MFDRIVQRFVRIVRLDTTVYREILRDEGATAEAAVVVAIASVLAALGAGFSAPRFLGGFLVELVAGVVLYWLLWSAVTMLVGTRVFGSHVTYLEVARPLGYANGARPGHPQHPGVHLWPPHRAGGLGTVARHRRHRRARIDGAHHRARHHDRHGGLDRGGRRPALARPDLLRCDARVGGRRLGLAETEGYGGALATISYSPWCGPKGTRSGADDTRASFFSFLEW